MIFWGLTITPINANFLLSPFIYFIVVFLVLFIAFFYAKLSIKDYQDRSVFLASSLVGNTGNLGIPLGIALFGLESVPYTSILNIANMFYIYIFSVYFFAGEKFKFVDALKEIFKIPAIWAAVFAILFNYFGFSLNDDFDKVFTMGAYSAIVMQLIIFGVFMSQVKIKSANWKLASKISFFKHIILPFSSIYIILYFDLEPLIAAIIFMELFVPLAVNNVNLASLYNCKPIDTTFSVLISSAVFILLIPLYLYLIKDVFGV